MPQGDTQKASNRYGLSQETTFPRCAADQSCIFPARFGHLCRTHFLDSLCQFSFSGSTASACIERGDGPFSRERTR